MVRDAVPYVIPYLAAAIVALGVLRVTWRRREHTGVLAFSVGMACVVVWSLGNAFELLAPTLAWKSFWVQVEYVGKALIPVAWLFTALHYSGRADWATARVAAVLGVVPLITIVLAWTHRFHPWLRYDVHLDTSGPFPVIAKEYGTWFWIHLGYSYLLILSATLLILDTLLRSRSPYRGQAAGWLIAALAPGVPNLLYVFDLSPFPWLDVTPAAFALSGVAIAWANRRFGILDVVPAAREKLLDAMREGVVVSDAGRRVVDLNGAAERIVGRPAADVIGRPVTETLIGWEEVSSEGEDGERVSEVELPGPRGPRVYEMRTTVLRWSDGAPQGFLTVLLDITESRRMRDTLTALSQHDELTGLHNRRGFTALAEHQLKLTVRKRRPLAVLFADLDRLKPINDVHGHEAGDRALETAARALRTALRETDVVARLAGDEFVALLPETPAADLGVVLERIETTLEREVVSEGFPFAVTLSIGVVGYDPTQEGPVTLDELLRRADRAMYSRKSARKAG
jgi:diguanylate cyclase (GGDEF)-like protein/PAS domain S-box-containing protein